MSFLPIPGRDDLFISIMGLFPPFIGKDAGIYLHTRMDTNWESGMAFKLPFAHRIETMNAGGYTYVQLDTGSEKVWVAGPVTVVELGTEITISQRMPMKNFHSNSLNRDFDVLYFVDRLSNADVATDQYILYVITPDQTIAYGWLTPDADGEIDIIIGAYDFDTEEEWLEYSYSETNTSVTFEYDSEETVSLH